MSIQDRIEKLIKQLSIKEKEELCKYIKAQYCVDDDAVVEEYLTMSDEIIEIIIEIGSVSFVNVDDIKPSTKLGEELYVDSMDIEKILIELENKFDLVKITRGSEITTVEDIIELVSKTEEGYNG